MQRAKAIAALIAGVSFVVLKHYVPFFGDDPYLRDLMAAAIVALIVERVPNKK